MQRYKVKPGAQPEVHSTEPVPVDLDRTDDLLDDIDRLIEETSHLTNYVQKGGQ